MQCFNARSRSAGPGHGRRIGYAVYDCGPTHRKVVVVRRLAEGRVDNQVDLAAANGVFNVRATFVNFVYPLGGDVVLAEKIARALRSHQLKPSRAQPASHRQDLLFVAVGDADKDPTARRQQRACSHLRLEEGRAKVGANAHDFARGLHLRPEQAIGPGEIL